MSLKYLIKNVWLPTTKRLGRQDILVQNGIITRIAPKINDAKATNIITGAGNYLLPGFLDVHVHFRDPGQTAKESIETGSRAAAHGGYTMVCAMPNVTPVPNTPRALAQLIQKNRAAGVVPVKQIAPVTTNERGNTLIDFKGMQQAGAVAFSNDGIGIQSAGTMYAAMQQIQATGLPLAAHVEEQSLMHGGVINAGTAANRLNLPGIDAVVETSQLARDLELARSTGVHYHVCHVSTARSVELIRRAKAEGINVTAEVTPHHLLLNDTMITADNPMYKMNPPLRTAADQQALLGGLLDGTIDMIATDHAPHTRADKGNSFLGSAFGITGLETAFPLLYTKLVTTKTVTLSQLINWMSTRPAELFQLPVPELAVGKKLNGALWDLTSAQTLKPATQLSKGTNSPFWGTVVSATQIQTFVNGHLVTL
ncbi:Dihydroorotase [Fructilactobacillus florum 8D]|uniref:Dihydroorotase n=1 Tax=Fructilactobacillus florum 8D TaxID=1221538 RepID=W9EGT3_9LACO|nr:dihydroorotase [Fructilactobacillus florum]EKK20146.1 Dihydroorotase [Fructilactobacillus florum 2F]ETO40225.1 Dihydroorotase [Fructilactobacillus florum 8D]